MAELDSWELASLILPGRIITFFFWKEVRINGELGGAEGIATSIY
jgi:hypothetical protein